MAAHVPTHNASSVKHGVTAANRTGSVVFTDDVTTDRHNRNNSEVYI